ncbi:MAG TPA: fumarylacetoacetate hydrolase family protein [Aldersonia sp.]
MLQTQQAPGGEDEGSPGAGVVLAQGRHGDGSPLPWLVARGKALPLNDFGESGLARSGSVSEIVEQWPTTRASLRALTTREDTATAILGYGIDVAALELEAPLAPRQTFCTIGNYRRQVVQAAEDAGEADGAAERRTAAQAMLRERAVAGDPYVCLTSSQRVAPPSSTLTLAPGIDTLDWEVELAVVLGATAGPGSAAPGAETVAGYCVAKDLTVRSRIVRGDVAALGSDWLQCKGMPGSLPLGPWFVPAWLVADPSRLRLRLWLNGTVMQDDTTGDMLFGIERQLHYLTRHTRLQPGDVLCTGSPAGFGAHYGRYLRAGDEIRAEVTGLGQQRLRCLAPDARDDLVLHAATGVPR